MLTKVDRQVSLFKGRMLKGKVGSGDQVRAQRLVHDEGDVPTGGTGAGNGAVQDRHTWLHHHQGAASGPVHNEGVGQKSPSHTR